MTKEQEIKLSHLCDRLCNHIINGESDKALKISQHLRDLFGFHIEKRIDVTRRT